MLIQPTSSTALKERLQQFYEQFPQEIPLPRLSWSEKLGSYLPKSLPNFFTPSFSSPGPANLKSQFAEADDLKSILKCHHEIEKLIYHYMNNQLKKVNKDIPLIEQLPNLSSLKLCTQLLMQMDKLLAEEILQRLENNDPLVQPFLKLLNLHYNGPSHENVLKRNPLAKKEEVENSNKNATKFIHLVGAAIILSFLKLEQSNTGKLFIEKLQQSFISKGHQLDIALMYKVGFRSIEINPKNTEAYLVSSSENSVEDEAIEIRAKARGSQKGQGSGSVLVLPISLNSPTEIQELYGVHFKNFQIVEQHLDDILSGSLGLTNNLNVVYSPFYMVIAHEMLHALHNSRGTNRASLYAFISNEKHYWSNPEEFWTITGGKLSEKILSLGEGLPPLNSHLGLSANALLKPDKVEGTQEPLNEYFGFKSHP